MEDTSVESPFGEFGEEALDSVSPRAGCGREVEGEAAMTIKPGPNLGVLMGGVVVENNVDGPVRRNLGVDRVQEANELLVSVALHITTDDRPIEHVQSGEERRGSVALVIVGHGAQAALLHGQPWLGAVKCLDLAFLINGQDDGVGRWIDVEPDDITQFVDEVGVIRELELPITVRLQAMGTPDAPNRAFADPDRRGHHCRRPMGRFDWRIGQRQSDHPLGHLGAQGRNARRPRLVAEKAIHALFHKPLLPAPDTGLGLAGPTHNCRCADTVGAQQNDCRPPHMFLGGIAIPDLPFETKPVRATHCEGYSAAHAPDSHMRSSTGIPKWTLMSGGNH